MRRITLFIVALVVAMSVAGFHQWRPSTAHASVLLAAAGDIADTGDNDLATSNLIDTAAEAAQVITMGDNAYEDGTLAQYNTFYSPTWGRAAILPKTHPSPGNHDYHTANAQGYRDYFPEPYGGVGPLYYTWTVPGWRFIALDSNIARGVGSAQDTFLHNTLTSNTQPCTVLYFHHARFSSGEHGNDTSVAEFYNEAWEHKVDIVLVGHDHDYERFAKLNSTGGVAALGAREFVVGTGGTTQRPFGVVQPNSQKRITGVWGVLKLTLNSVAGGDAANSYSWSFRNTANVSLDSGTNTCN